jgi:hypothetical protein
MIAFKSSLSAAQKRHSRRCWSITGGKPDVSFSDAHSISNSLQFMAVFPQQIIPTDC